MSFRIENKYELSTAKLPELYEFLKNSSAKEIYPKRLIKSIYFDNHNFSAYRESIGGVVPRKKIRIRKIIPSHSIIIGAWLNMGIFGFIISLYLFYTFLKLFFRVYLRIANNKYLPIIIILSVEMMWHFLFSPFGHIKNTFPIIVSLLIIVNSKDFNKVRLIISTLNIQT